MFTTWSKTADSLTKERQKQEKLVNDLTSPMLKLESLRTQESVAHAAWEADKAEYLELEAEWRNIQEDTKELCEVVAELDTVLAVLNKAETLRVRGYCGGTPDVYASAVAALKDDEDLLRVKQSRIKVIIARQKELEAKYAS